MHSRARVILGSHKIDAIFVIQILLAYLGVFACIGSAFTALIYIYYAFLPDQPFYSVVLFLSGIAILLASAAHPLRIAIQKWLGQLFYGGSHSYRVTLLNFGSKIGNFINLEELANEMLPTMSKALLITQTSLMITDEKGDFTVRFCYPESENGASHNLHVGRGNPIVLKLEKENTPFETGTTNEIPELDEMPEPEREFLKANPQVLCPIKSRGRLVGILSLGPKQSGNRYTSQEMKMIMSVTGQIGPMIENAQLYSQAVALSVTDGLTGLFNHRHFHRVIEQEIARCARYNSAFSLIMLDIDLFKKYNDTFGHLAGDGVLREVAEAIMMSIRSADTAFRYGGEEFAIILPETKLQNAYTVAERIRQSIEKKKSSVTMTVTASLGVACWDAKGVTKEQIISQADAALYEAKRTGRNKTCLSLEATEI